MIKPQIEKRTSLLTKEIEQSKKLSSEEKMDYQTMLLAASEGTNGLSKDEKLQSVSETVYSIVTLLISKRIDQANNNEKDWKSGLFRMLIECKWQLVIIVAIVCSLLLFQPEIAAILAGLF